MHRATLLSILVVIGTACAAHASAGDTVLPAIAAAAVATTPSTTLDPAVQCVSTDPGWRPLSVHRAVNCPDGTVVTVAGVVIHKPDGTESLCDSNAVTDDCLTIDGVTAAGLPAAISGEVVYRGVVVAHRLTLLSHP